LEFLERSGPGLYALLTRMTLSEDVAEDLMQELFIKLSKSNRLDKAENPKAYARRCAINLAFDWRQRMQSRALPLNEVREPASNQLSPAEELVGRERLQEVLAAIARLSGLSREAFVLHHIEQNSYEQIAEELDKQPHQARALCFKAMTRLRTLLGESRRGTGQKGDA
jgi:RNA polymerase sigma-70 factor (ECF subfamily)